MATLKRDANHKTVAGGISSTDGVTPLMFMLDPITGFLLVESTSDTITVIPAQMDKRDQNHVPTMYGVSSADGTTLVPIRTDINGNLLVTFT